MLLLYLINCLFHLSNYNLRYSFVNQHFYVSSSSDAFYSDTFLAFFCCRFSFYLNGRKRHEKTGWFKSSSCLHTSLLSFISCYLCNTKNMGCGGVEIWKPGSFHFLHSVHSLISWGSGHVDTPPSVLR